MSFCSLTKGITLKICRLCLCHNKKVFFEPFMCLDLVLECYQWFLFQIFIFLLQFLLLFPVTQLTLTNGCADSTYHLHFYLIKEIQPKGCGSSEALSGDQRILIIICMLCLTFLISQHV